MGLCGTRAPRRVSRPTALTLGTWYMKFDFNSLLIRAHEASLTAIQTISFDVSNSWQRYLIALYASMIEYTSACLILMKENVHSTIPTITRSLIEAHIDFVNLANRPEYGWHLEAAARKEALKVFKESKKRSNRLLLKMAEHPKIDGIIAQYERDYEKLRADSFDALHISDKFNMAGELDVYRSVYNDLCSESHNGLRSLSFRHMSLVEGKITIELYKHLDDVSWGAFSIIISSILALDGCKLFNTLQQKTPSNLAVLMKETEALLSNESL
jgi:hypothetical protein